MSLTLSWRVTHHCWSCRRHHYFFTIFSQLWSESRRNVFLLLIIIRGIINTWQYCHNRTLVTNGLKCKKCNEMFEWWIELSLFYSSGDYRLNVRELTRPVYGTHVTCTYGVRYIQTCRMSTTWQQLPVHFYTVK